MQTSDINSESIAHGTPEMYREHIHEMLEMAQIQAELGTTYAAIGDDTGLEYALRRLKAYMRAAIGSFVDLRAMKEGGDL